MSMETKYARKQEMFYIIFLSSPSLEKRLAVDFSWQNLSNGIYAVISLKAYCI